MESYPAAMLIFIPIVPCLLLGLLLPGISVLKAKVLPKGPAVFTIAVLFVLILGRFIPSHLFDHVFSLIHLAFVWFGACLATEKKQALPSPVRGIGA